MTTRPSQQSEEMTRIPIGGSFSSADQYLRQLQQRSLRVLSQWAVKIGVLNPHEHYGVTDEFIQTHSKNLNKQFKSILASLDTSVASRFQDISLGFLFLPEFNGHSFRYGESEIITLNIRLQALLLRYNAVFRMWISNSTPYSLMEYIADHVRDKVDPLRDIVKLPYEQDQEAVIAEYFAAARCDETSELVRTEIMVKDQLLFALAHEMGHVIAGHLNEEEIDTRDEACKAASVDSIYRSREQEFEADRLGADIMVQVQNIDLSEGLTFISKIAFFFLAAQLEDKVSRIFKQIDSAEQLPVQIHPESINCTADVLSHPSAYERIIRLQQHIFIPGETEAFTEQKLRPKYLQYCVDFFDVYLQANLSLLIDRNLIALDSAADFSTPPFEFSGVGGK